MLPDVPRRQEAAVAVPAVFVEDTRVVRVSGQPQGPATIADPAGVVDGESVSDQIGDQAESGRWAGFRERLRGMREETELLVGDLAGVGTTRDQERLIARLERIESLIEELEGLAAAEASAQRKTAWRQFALGLVLGLPVGLLGSLIAHVLGW